MDYFNIELYLRGRVRRLTVKIIPLLSKNFDSQSVTNRLPLYLQQGLNYFQETRVTCSSLQVGVANPCPTFMVKGQGHVKCQMQTMSLVSNIFNVFSFWTILSDIFKFVL